jgi:hypothetical protein
LVPGAQALPAAMAPDPMSGDVGHVAEEEAGVEVDPFWGGAEEKSHLGRLPVAACGRRKGDTGGRLEGRRWSGMTRSARSSGAGRCSQKCWWPGRGVGEG